MTGFRQFAQVVAQPDPVLVDLLRQAKLLMEDPWEEEFLVSIERTIMAAWNVSAKQRNLLERIASGAVAEQRAQRDRAEEESGVDQMPSVAAAGMDDVRVTEEFNRVRDASLRELSRDGYDHDRGY